MGAVNKTAASEDVDEHGGHYSASFELFPYSETSEEAFYLGRYSRECRTCDKHDDLCRVRALRHKMGRNRHWETHVRIGEVAQAMARDFNKEVLKEANKITFSVPVRAAMDSVVNEYAPPGCCVACCRPHSKKLLMREVVLLEPYFSSHENEYYSDGTGNCENENLSTSDREITQAFSHYSWHHSGGKYVICGLKGRNMDRKYLFRGPTIHSNPDIGDKAEEDGTDAEMVTLTETFGRKDEEMEGILQFFANHECNQMCKSFSKP